MTTEQDASHEVLKNPIIVYKYQQLEQIQASPYPSQSIFISAQKIAHAKNVPHFDRDLRLWVEVCVIPRDP